MKIVAVMVANEWKHWVDCRLDSYI